uniref:histidine kinase n=1 Tax=Desulfatirhabdium butyrativorans TaxID=340467 RepID=A0A7C4RU62_9BACT
MFFVSENGSTRCSKELAFVASTCRWLAVENASIGHPDSSASSFQEAAQSPEASMKPSLPADDLDIYRLYFENDSNGSFISTAEGQILDCNPALLDILGYDSKEALLSQNAFERYLTPELRLLFLTQLMQHRKVEYFPCELKRSDGSSVAVMLQATALFNSRDEITHIMGRILEVSKLNQSQSQIFEASKLEALGTLAGGIAHNFNNILAGIQGNASLIGLDPSANTQQKLRVRDIETLVERGAKVTSQMLGFAQKGKYQVLPLDLNRVIESVRIMIEGSFRNVEVRLHPFDEAVVIDADPNQIEQMLLTLCINACEAMPSGGTLDITIQKRLIGDFSKALYPAQPGVYGAITVQDTGVGISPEHLPKIFEPFFTTKPMHRGSGLGLASVFGIVRNHSGAIWVESELGVGTTFTVAFPLSRHSAECRPEPEPAADPPVIDTILFVDDEPLLRDVASQMITRLGYEVLTAATGQEALRLYQKHHDRIRVVILDMMMPDWNGIETFERLQAFDPRVRVLICSGFTSDVTSNLLKKGCKGFIQKPFSMSDLKFHILNALHEPAAMPA